MTQETSFKKDMRPLIDKATSVVRKLQDKGWETYFAGGCVRDMLLGIPAKDFDIATAATPDEVISTFPKTIAIGAQFGVIQVRYGGEGFEVATFREDGGYTDGRRPDSVTFSNALEDVKRRDFTINGLLFDPITKQLHDFVSGEEDLHARVIRAIGDPGSRIEEDYLRMLRAVRFAGRFNFTIEAETMQAVQENAQQIKEVSRERIREELFKTFAGANGLKGLALLEESRLLACLFPESWANKDNQFSLALKAAESFPQGNPLLFFTLLLKDMEHQSAEAFTRELTFSNTDRKTLLAMIQGLPDLEELKANDIPAVKRLVRQGWWNEFRHVADGLQSIGHLGGPSIESLQTLQAQWSHDDLWPQPFLNGSDLKSLGLPPGPRFKALINTLETLQLEEKIESREAAIEWVLQQEKNTRED